MSSHTRPAVRAYLARVRTALSDLPPDEVDEIVEDVRPHLAEIADGLGADATLAAMTAELGSPEDYAAEVRAAGDYPPPPGPSGDGDRTEAPVSRLAPRTAFWGLALGVPVAALLGLALGLTHEAAPRALFAYLVLVGAGIGLAALAASTRGTDQIRDLPEVRWLAARSGLPARLWTLLGVLSPLGWWLAAAVLALLGVLLAADDGWPALPLMIGLAALVLWAGPRSRTDHRKLWATLPVTAFVTGTAVGLAGALLESAVEAPHASPHDSVYGGATGEGTGELFHDGERLDNLYVFDAEGKPLTDVYLYTEDGRPLSIPRYGCDEHTSARIRTGSDNLFPRPRVETGAVDDHGTVGGYNAYRPVCAEREGVPFTVAVPTETPGGN
ncbi:DUF1700 domain-containing protein [Saccharomonospora iraqiensis]|uniref:DUF1700 domain-containing protein n=1 Tax=Saccharomonospora iraqiensis TaxID=52698 RepID=UPI00022DF8B1|nr:hypothetical protein [Saccharomonospora iraqiensis]